VTVEIAVGSTLAGFRIQRSLGHGAMGAVYLAEDAHLLRKVAIKVLARQLAEDERFRRRFLLESQLAAGLEHPHIVPIYAAGEEDGVLFLAMKYVEGYDLRELVDASDRVGDERVLTLLTQVGDALDAAHGLGLVHRDVKPANILIGAGETEHAYLCDFGLARHASTVESLTSERAFVGTIAYIAPEQIESGAVDARADIYALGCVLFECLTGTTPFEREGDLKVLFAHVNEPPPLVTTLRPDLPEAIDAIVQKALAKAPDDRYSTCAELIADAQEALSVEPPKISYSIRRTIPGVRTFLFADIRGYTSYTAEHGDEAAATLAAQFAEIVRQVVEEREGRLIQLRGDEALVVFESARQALRSAVELQARIAADGLPRPAGVGLDAGEAVPVSDGYRGGALNLAARLCSLAGGGEVLATETVLQLARTVEGIRYGMRRPERLKGFAKPVTVVEVLPAESRVSRWERRRLKLAAKRTMRSGRARILAGILVAGAIAAGLVLAFAGSGSAAGKIEQESVGFVSPDGKLQGQLPVGGVGALGMLGKTLWFANESDKTFERIDPRKRKLIHPFVSIEDGFNGEGFGAGAVWAVDAIKPLLMRIDPHYLTIQRIPLPGKASDIDTTSPTGVAFGAGSVWVADASKVFRVDPTSLRVVKTIDVDQASQVTFGNGSLWVVSNNTSTITQINPAVGEVVRSFKLRNWINDLVVAGGFLWATVIPDDQLWKLDQNGTPVRTFDIGHQPGGLASFDGAVWVASDDKLSRVDPDSDEVTDYPLYDRGGGLAVGDGVLYVNTAQSPPKLPPAPADQVANVALPENFLDDTDPAHAWPNTFRWQLEYATGAQLLNYPDAPAPRGARLQPEVAAALPSVSADGRTYTFRIRPGYRFSPPSNQPVTAETFRYSIERALSPGLGAGTPGIEYLRDVVGAEEFNAGKAAHLAGITVRGDVLRIRLVAPAGDFLARLSMPFFAAVPIGTPIVDGGVQKPIPSAGPYYLKVSWGGELLVLERNPNYHGPRPHRLQQIVYDTASGTRRTVGEIENGTADYTADVLGDTTYAPGGALAARYGLEHAGAARPLLVQTPQFGLRFVQFNAAPGRLFADARLRKAVSLALDRRQLATATQSIPDDDLLPPALSSPPSRVLPLSPDLAHARALAGAKKRVAVLYLSKDASSPAVARLIATELARIGIDVRVQERDDVYSAMSDRGSGYDLAVASWIYDWPDPAAFLGLWFTDTGFRPPWAPAPLPVPAATRRRLEHASTLTGAARARAYARADLELRRDVVPLAAFGTPTIPELFSGRVGCRVEQPIFGAVDLGALCIRKS
jgi:serine/threonine-protein kinase